MKQIGVLFGILLALAAFVYFYEIKGQEEREEARRLEESLLRVGQEDIVGIEIQRSGNENIVLRREGDQWRLQEPIDTAADESTVNSLLGALENAQRKRTFPEGATEAEKYGLDAPRYTVRIRTGEQEKTLRIGAEDFTETNVYVQLDGESSVFLTSDSLVTNAEKDLMQWRDKSALTFERSAVQAIEITNDSGRIQLERKQGDWFLETPIGERADQSFVSSLLSTLEFAQVQEFVSERPEALENYGLSNPAAKIRIREEGASEWRGLELGKQEEENYFARNPHQSAVFTVATDVYEKISEQLWAFRDKDVLDVDEGQIAELVIQSEEEEMVFTREDSRWVIQSPESEKGNEAQAYKFWYPIDDVKFESIQDKNKETFPEPAVRVRVALEEGGEKVFEFARKGDRYLARRVESGRQGTISEEDFQKLHFELQDVVSSQ